MKVCGIYHISDIDEVALKIKNRISSFSYDYINYLQNRYNPDMTYEVNLKGKMERLQTYLKILTGLKEKTLSGGDVCLNRKELQMLMEKIVRIIGKKCRTPLKDYDIDTSNEEIWLMKYPYCRSYQEWEKWSKRLCEKLELEISAEEEVAMQLVFEISREVITPDLLLAISAYTEVKESLTLEVSRTTEEIELDFQLLLEKVPTCDLTLEIYRDLIENHKLSFDIVKQVYDSGLQLQLSSGEVEMKTPVNVYNLAQISGKINPKYLEKFGMKSSADRDKFLQDYK